MSRLLLITGAVGIGKTRLLRYLTSQAAECADTAAIVLSPVDLTSPEGLILRMDEALSAKGGLAKAAGIKNKVNSVQIGISPIASIGGTKDSYRPTLSFSHMLRDTSSAKVWQKKVLVVAIDEVQSADPRCIDQLQTLHLGQHGCPILTIAAALQRSDSILNDLRISTKNHRRLEPLSSAETERALSFGLKELGVDAKVDIVEQLAVASMGFPQQIHDHIEAARAVHEERGEINSPDAVAEVLESGQKLRDAYYFGQLRTMLSEDQLYRLLMRMARENVDSVTFEEAKSIVGVETVNAAVQLGLLEKHVDGVLSFGTPSFHACMVEHSKRDVSGGQKLGEGKNEQRSRDDELDDAAIQSADMRSEDGELKARNGELEVAATRLADVQLENDKLRSAAAEHGRQLTAAQLANSKLKARSDKLEAAIAQLGDAQLDNDALKARNGELEVAATRLTDAQLENDELRTRNAKLEAQLSEQSSFYEKKGSSTR